MFDLVGTELTEQERTMLRHPQTGGVILFTRNFDSITQLTELIDEIHALRVPRLLIAVDQEGGRVQRFHNGFTTLPAVRQLGHIYDHDRQRARHYAETTGWLMAAELRAVGIDFSFAPVLDLERGVSGVIGDRAFHRQPDAVADLAHHYMIGMKRAGMVATGKHFPGHGCVKEDSHTDLPVDKRPEQDILLEDMVPFERMIHYGLAGIMPAHVIYTCADQQPAGYSNYWLKIVLRKQLRFEGVIFSDDLSMEAANVAGGYAERAQTALDAGCDMVLVCNHPEGAREVLESLDDYENPASQLRLTRLHGRKAPGNEALRASEEWQQAVALVQSYDSSPWLEMDV